MPAFDYRYELRDGEEVLATGRMSRDRELDVGERIRIAGHSGVVRSVEPVLGDRAQRVVVEVRSRM